MMTPSTSDVMILPNAAPMITATARSTTFPRAMKSLNSLSILFSPPDQPTYHCARARWCQTAKIVQSRRDEILIAGITRNESSGPFMGGDVALKRALEFKRVRGAIKISSLRDFDDLRLSFAGAYSSP